MPYHDPALRRRLQCVAVQEGNPDKGRITEASGPSGGSARWQETRREGMWLEISSMPSFLRVGMIRMFIGVPCHWQSSGLSCRGNSGSRNAQRPATAEREYLNVQYFWLFTPDIPFGPDKFGLFPFPLA